VAKVHAGVAADAGGAETVLREGAGGADQVGLAVRAEAASGGQGNTGENGSFKEISSKHGQCLVYLVYLVSLVHLVNKEPNREIH
jgi:hypothetical protein